MCVGKGCVYMGGWERRRLGSALSASDRMEKAPETEGVLLNVHLRYLAKPCLEMKNTEMYRIRFGGRALGWRETPALTFSPTERRLKS